MVYLEGGEYRAELRASIAVEATRIERQCWRYCNGKVKTVVQTKPGLFADEVAAYILKRRPAIVSRARTIAAPRGAKPIDIILEQVEFWKGYNKLPGDPWIIFAQLHFGRGYDDEAAADDAGIDDDEAAVVAHIVNDHLSYREIESKTGVSKSKVGDVWHDFLDAVEDGECQCHCDNPHCSLNKRDDRKRVVRLIKANWKAGIKSRLSKAASLKGARGKVTGHVAGRKGGVAELGDREYVFTVVNDKLPVLCHRLVWTLANGRIPSEHEIHHVDGDPINNAIDNLAMLPKWIHRIIH